MLSCEVRCSRPQQGGQRGSIAPAMRAMVVGPWRPGSTAAGFYGEQMSSVFWNEAPTAFQEHWEGTNEAVTF